MAAPCPIRILVTCLLLAGCGSETTPDLFVDVRTDVRPGHEFQAVRVDLLGATSAGPTQVQRPATADEHAEYLEGLRVARYEEVSSADPRVRVALLDAEGLPILERTTAVHLGSRNRIVTVVLTRDCAGVTCPGAGDAPSLEACLGGRCVTPRCTPETPEHCPTDCVEDSDCAVEASCAVARCETGTCFRVEREGSCSDLEWCHPERGCVAQPQDPECTSDEDCMVFNMIDGLPSTCRKYYCAGTVRCQRHPDGSEPCDGWDNDCDGKIDESGVDGQTLVPEGMAVATNVTNVAHMSHGAGGSRADVAWTTTDGSGFVASLAGEGTLSATPSRNTTDSLRSKALEPGCYRATEFGILPHSCSSAEMVSTPVGARRLVAMITQSGCSDGLLYAGFVENGDDRIVIRGPLRRSNSFYGVDPTTSRVCTGASRATCAVDGSGSGCGAARPALATIDHGPPSCAPDICPDRVGQGLVAFLGAGLARDRCGGSEVAVEALGLHLMIAPYDGALLWVTASNEGVPQALGTTAGGGHPAVVALGSEGYLVAHGAPSGEVALSFVPTLAEPPSYDGVSGDPDDRTGQETGPIEGVVDLGRIGGLGGTPDHVALSVGGTREGELDLGMAWLEGCGADEVVVFRRVLVSTIDGKPESAVASADAVRLSEAATADAVLDAPQVSYRPSGFVVDGFERGGPTAGDASDGGWIVAWTRGTDVDGDGRPDGRMIARRVAELDGQPVDDAERIDLTRSDEDDAWQPFVDHERFAYWDRAGDRIVAGTLSCGN